MTRVGRHRLGAALAAAIPTLLAAVAAGLPATAAAQPALVERDLRRTALSIAAALRVAEGCRIRVAEPARHRAAEIEAALAALDRARQAAAGGGGARFAEHDAAMAEAREGAARAGRAWCSGQRADVEEVEEMLASPEGERLLERLRALGGARG